jgi:hypothetical protein
MAQEKDRWEIATFIVETVAAVGVIFSVIYLAIQVGGTNSALRAQTHDNLLTQLNQPIMLAVDNAELSDLVLRGMSDPSTLSDVEWSRYANYLIITNNTWEYGYYLNRDAATPPELWVGMDAYYSDLAKNQPGLKRFWKEYGFGYAEPFHSYADQFFSTAIPAPN